MVYGRRIAGCDVLAGFSAEDADALRKIMSKRQRERGSRISCKFFGGARKSKASEDAIDEIWK